MVAEFAIFVAELANFGNFFNKIEILVNNSDKIRSQYDFFFLYMYLLNNKIADF